MRHSRCRRDLRSKARCHGEPSCGRATTPPRLRPTVHRRLRDRRRRLAPGLWRGRLVGVRWRREEAQHLLAEYQRKQRDAIYKDPEMPAAQKRAEIDEIQLLMNAEAREAMQDAEAEGAR